MSKSKKVKVKSGCQESDRQERVDKIIDLMSDIDYGDDQDLKAHNVLSFSKSNLSLDEIAKLLEPFKEGYKESKNAQINRSGLY